MKEGKELRYKYWLEKVDELATVCNLTRQQIVLVLSKINEFKNMYNFVETDYFVNVFLSKEMKT